MDGDAGAFDGSQINVTSGSPHGAILGWGRQLNVAYVCKQIDAPQNETREDGGRRDTEATEYAEEAFCLIALLPDVP
jgi:hypothetical protein